MDDFSENSVKVKTSFFWRFIRISFLAGTGASIMAAVMAFLWLKEIGIFTIEDAIFNPILNYKENDNTLVYDRDGKKIGELFNRYQVNIPYEKLPQDLVNAIIAIEDRSFFEHQGIDLRGIARAAYDRLHGQKLKQGASTITQQVVRHFLLSRDRTLERKLTEAVMSLRLEQLTGKEKIMQLYTNALFLGNGAYGVGAAAQRYFGKKLDDLELHEYAVIAGLFQSPSRYNPQRYPERAKTRQKQVLRAMFDTGMISKAQMMTAVKKPLHYEEYQVVNTQLAPYFLDYVRENAVNLLGHSILNRGLRVYTTLNSDFQGMANSSMKEKQEIFQKAYKAVLIPFDRKGQDPGIQGALLSLNPQTGEILTMVGGLSYNQSKFNRTVQARRQPGSSFKPVIYSLAIAEGLKWSDLIYVSPVAVENYRPKNFSDQFLTETTMLRAFYLSINTPAIEVGSKLGLDKVVKQAERLGISTPIKMETGTMLGASEVTMLDMVHAYSTFANQGVRVDPYAITKITDENGRLLYEVPTVAERSTRVLSDQDAYLMVQAMRAVFQHGTAFSENDLGQVAAGKTGTSNNSKDNWFVGYTPEVATAVWVGSDKSYEFLGSATGTALALPIWANYMRKVIARAPPKPFIEPTGIVAKKVHAKYGYTTPDGLTMYFKQGQEPTRETSDLQVISQTGKYRTIFEN